ncbi:MAG: peptide chain release factor N(5)-glutamine methyltransferase [Solirubrobacteraceae bacterium]
MSAPAARAPRRVAGTSIDDALQGAITAISAAGCETPRLDAEVLLAHTLGVARERLLIDRELEVAGGDVRAFQDAVRRRAVLREPVAYIIERRAFRGLDLRVDRRVLVPRPETELLVECALALEHGASVLDVGTGSGAVALALKDERADLRVTASDVSEDALQLARGNARCLDLDVELLQADLLDGLEDRFDAVLANLPYVAESERSMLQPEIVKHEPPLALFAGADGLAQLRALAGQLARRPRVRWVALEHGADQAADVAELVRAAGFANVECMRDLAGMQRVVMGVRKGP